MTLNSDVRRARRGVAAAAVRTSTSINKYILTSHCDRVSLRHHPHRPLSFTPLPQHLQQFRSPWDASSSAPAQTALSMSNVSIAQHGAIVIPKINNEPMVSVSRT